VSSFGILGVIVEKKRIRTLGVITVGILLFLLGSLTSWFIVRPSQTETKPTYPFLAKRVQIDNPNEQRINFTDLRKDLETAVQAQNNESQNVSLYFEYLPTGVAVNINENSESIAASLMKVPVVMTLYQAATQGKIDLDKKIALREEWLNDQYGMLYQKGAGYQISIRDAARLALKDSDNTALLLVFEQIKPVINENESVLNFLDLEYDTTSDERVLITAQSYSSILKCLYFACYNSKQDSQEILQYLTESSFNNRLTEYLPDSLKVAHKIGTFSKEYQSDCGIFYVPERNYLLCIMVKGNDPEASQSIAKLSKQVYDYIIEQITSPENNL
jgi:beta-lactamase class A